MTRFASTALALLLSTGTALAEPEIAGTQVPFEAPAILEMLPELDAWLDSNTDLPRPAEEIARIEFVAAGTEVPYAGQTAQLDSTVRGLYDEDSATIYLVRPWFGDTARDRSILLHELAHHRQAHARHWYCPQEMEWDAYLLQDDYLADQGETLDVNWTWVLLASSCATRDHHPD